ncbi:unnamed protein product [Protopolystoma xenopodis]|uniref:Uncharacterized protein n=1 Tax=Protopolystoma xenopodis TaxID=117903 RepID=A0A448XRF4_9PLAT|nr:unnamed protein product [Protopolystoma xenopodis]
MMFIMRWTKTRHLPPESNEIASESAVIFRSSRPSKPNISFAHSSRPQVSIYISHIILGLASTSSADTELPQCIQELLFKTYQ